MESLYTAAIRLYGWLLRLLAAFGHKRAHLWVEGRKNWRNALERLPSDRPVIWFHTASAGEFEQARPLIEWHRRFHPQHAILVTFYSPSGYELRKDYALADVVCYLPEDTPEEVAAWHARLQLRIAIFIKYEFWFHHYRELKARNIPLLLVSAPFRPNQPFFNWPTRAFWGKMLASVHHFYVQDTASASLLQQLGLHNHTVVGDTRTDRVLDIAQQPFIDPLLEAFARGHAVLVAGSTWPADEALLQAWLERHPSARLIIAPHTVNAHRTSELLSQFGRDARAYTNSHPEQMAETRVLVLNTMGMLGKVYRYGQAAYIGGGFGKGIHNTLEAAVYGIPVYFGPKNQKFIEAGALQAAGLAFEITTSAALGAYWEKHLDAAWRLQLKRNATSWFDNQAGASKRIMAQVEALLREA